MALLIGSSFAQACSVSDITIKQADWRSSPTRVTDTAIVEVFGEFTNNCAERTLVQLHYVFRDATGKVVTARSDWATSSAGVGPAQSFAFSKSILLDSKISTQIKTMSASVVDTHKVVNEPPKR